MSWSVRSADELNHITSYDQIKWDYKPKLWHRPIKYLSERSIENALAQDYEVFVGKISRQYLGFDKKVKFSNKWKFQRNFKKFKKR